MHSYRSNARAVFEVISLRPTTWKTILTEMNENSLTSVKDDNVTTLRKLHKRLHGGRSIEPYRMLANKLQTKAKTMTNGFDRVCGSEGKYVKEHMQALLEQYLEPFYFVNDLVNSGTLENSQAFTRRFRHDESGGHGDRSSTEQDLFVSCCLNVEKLVTEQAQYPLLKLSEKTMEILESGMNKRFNTVIQELMPDKIYPKLQDNRVLNVASLNGLSIDSLAVMSADKTKPTPKTESLQTTVKPTSVTEQRPPVQEHCALPPNEQVQSQPGTNASKSNSKTHSKIDTQKKIEAAKGASNSACGESLPITTSAFAVPKSLGPNQPQDVSNATVAKKVFITSAEENKVAQNPAEVQSYHTPEFCMEHSEPILPSEACDSQHHHTRAHDQENGVMLGEPSCPNHYANAPATKTEFDIMPPRQQKKTGGHRMLIFGLTALNDVWNYLSRFKVKQVISTGDPKSLTAKRMFIAIFDSRDEAEAALRWHMREGDRKRIGVVRERDLKQAKRNGTFRRKRRSRPEKQSPNN